MGTPTRFVRMRDMVSDLDWQSKGLSNIKYDDKGEWRQRNNDKLLE